MYALAWSSWVAGAAPWRVVGDDRLYVGPLEPWTSTAPDVAVDGEGTVWIGFTTRYEGERYHTSVSGRHPLASANRRSNARRP